MPGFKAQFMGRFAYLYAGDGTVAIVGPHMHGFKPHTATLSIPTRFVDAGEDHSFRVITVPGDVAGTFMLWDLDNVDVEFGDYQANPVAQEFEPPTQQPGIADIVVLAANGNGNQPRISPSIAARQFNNGSDLEKRRLPPIATRINIGGGTLRPVDTVTAAESANEFFAFKPFDDRTSVPVDDPGAVRLADAMEWRGETLTSPPEDPGPGRGLTIRLRKFDGSFDRKILCKPTKELVLGFTYTCNCLGAIDRDEEFAAYYTLLETPPPMAQRKIPALRPSQAGFVCSSSPDCMAPATAKIG